MPLACANVSQYTPRRWTSGANAATSQNPDSGSDDSKPQHEAHSANAMRVETMAGERHVCRATLRLVEREPENTVENQHHAHQNSEADTR